MRRRLIIGAHCDDIILGAAGMLLNTKDEYDTTSFTLCKGRKHNESLQRERVRVDHKNLKECGINKIIQEDYYDLSLDYISNLEINQKIEELIFEIKPHEVICINKDDHFDHKILYNAVKLATRMNRYSFIQSVIAYDIPSAMNLNKDYTGYLFEDIQHVENTKISMLEKYKTENINLAEVYDVHKIFGYQSGNTFAERFKIIYQRK